MKKPTLAYPANAFNTQTGNTATVNSTVNVNGTGFQAQMILMNAGAFKRGHNNAYIGNFDDRVTIQVVGE